MPLTDLQKASFRHHIHTTDQLIDADTGEGAGYQPLDSDLTAIAALSTTSFGRSVLDRADAAALRTLAGVGAIGQLATIKVVIPVVISGGGVAITSSLLPVLVPVPADLTLTAWELVADASGTLSLTIKDSTRANIGSGTSIVASDHPLISSQRVNNGTCSGWTTGLTGGHWLEVIVDSSPAPATVKQATLNLSGTRAT